MNAEMLPNIELISLAKNISCNFVDAQTSSKEFVKRSAENICQDESNTSTNNFVLSTCLRYEIYDCSRQQRHTAPFFYSSGTSCLRRLLSVLVGLQSEIKGEREILMQMSDSVKDSFNKGTLDDISFQGMQQLISISENIRQSCEINSEQNYSTIACDLFSSHLDKYDNATIAIVGGGYMADKFFSSILKSSSLKIKKIYWLNRTTNNLRSRYLQIAHLLKFDIEVLDLETGRYVLKEADAIFCALSKSPYFYTSYDYREDCFLVDVSYPQVFAEGNNTKTITISNTFFENFVKEVLTKDKILQANKMIDNFISDLNNSL